MLYPAYASYKAVRTKNVKEYVKWMMYWIVFALFKSMETFTDVFFSFWFPFYYEIKIVLLVYLLSPYTKGSSLLYRQFVHPAMVTKEQEIDEMLSVAQSSSYSTVMGLVQRGGKYLTGLVMEGVLRVPVMDNPQMGTAYNTNTNIPTVDYDDMTDDDLEKETFLIEDDQEMDDLDFMPDGKGSKTLSKKPVRRKSVRKTRQ